MGVLFEAQYAWTEFSLAQSRPFDLLVFQSWSIVSKGPKRFTFYFQVFWASETWFQQQEARIVALFRHFEGAPAIFSASSCVVARFRRTGLTIPCWQTWVAAPLSVKFFGNPLSHLTERGMNFSWKVATFAESVLVPEPQFAGCLCTRRAISKLCSKVWGRSMGAILANRRMVANIFALLLLPWIPPALRGGTLFAETGGVNQSGLRR